MEMTNQAPGAPKQIKISLADLPPGTGEGDSLTVKVTNVNQATGVAFLSADSPQPSQSEPEEDTQPENESNPKDTSVLLGPMDGLKNYLVKKSMDAPSNSGR